MNELQALRDRVQQLEEALGMGKQRPRPPGFGKIATTLMGLLIKRPLLQREVAYLCLYGDLPEDRWPGEKILDAHICKLRRALVPHGIQIETRWSEGWCLTDENRRKARELFG